MRNLNLPFRLRNFSLHLAASLALFGTSIALLYWGWYAWPNFYLMGAARIVGLAALVDLCLGPLATFIVSERRKPVAELRRDIALIVLVQLGALGYGLSVLWSGRPVAIVFSQDRASLVSAAMIAPQDLVEAGRAGKPFSLYRRPSWFWAPLPGDAVERDRIVRDAILNGKDVTAMPKYFQPFSEARQVLGKALLPLPKLRGLPGMDPKQFDLRCAQLAGGAARYGALPIEGRDADGVFIVERDSLKPAEFWRVSPWSAMR